MEEYPYQAGPSTAIGTLKLMPENTQQIARFSKMLIEDVQNGTVNPLELLVMLRALEAVSETVRESIKHNIEAAADKYSEKSFDVLGARVEKSEVGVKYNYETCGDPEWERYSVDERTAAGNRRGREEFLRTLREPVSLYNPETGETWTIKPPLKRSTSGLKVFLK